VKLYKDGITIEVTQQESGRYLRLGYTEVKDPEPQPDPTAEEKVKKEK
jgi:hypothetical protein